MIKQQLSTFHCYLLLTLLQHTEGQVIDRDHFEVGAMKLLNKKTPHSSNAVAKFSEGFSPTDISPRAIGTTTPFETVLKVRSMRCNPLPLTSR